MKKDWTDFQKIKKGKHTVRNAFNELCNELLNKHYPTKKLIQVTDFTGKETEEKQIILYQSKFFTDELTNSRKGQIRKAFNETVALLNPDKQKLYSWIVCLPITLKEEDIVWWHNWKSKMAADNNFNIKIFEGEELLEMLNKYNLFNKWFEITEPKKEEYIEEKIKEDEDIFEFVLDSNFVEETIQKENKKEDETKITENKTEKVEEIDDRVPEEEIVEPKKVKAQRKHVEIKYSYQELYASYKKTKSKIARLNKDDKAFFDEIYNKNDFPKNRFGYELTEEDKKQLTTDLYYFAKLNKINEKYEKALIFYEELLKREDLGEAIPIDQEDIRETCNFCGDKIYARNKIYEGDYYYTIKELITSLNCYEKSLKLYPEDKNAFVKYNEAFGDSLLSENLFLEARRKYAKAKKVEPNNEIMEEKALFALHMLRGNKLFAKPPASWLNPLFSPYYYNKASKIDNENKYLKTRKAQANKKLFYIFSVAIAIILLFLVIKVLPPLPSRSVKTVKAMSVVTMYDIAMKKGNHYYDNFSNHNAHYLDSAMVFYRKAIYYKPSDSLAPIKYESTRERHEDFINEIQTKIKLDTTAYFTAIRPEKEGLRLFKYSFEPYDKENGKYGYIDKNYNIIIPPVYDFNEADMKNIGESFNNGKALVCLKTKPNNTIYFLIDKRGTRVSKRFKGIKK